MEDQMGLIKRRVLWRKEKGRDYGRRWNISWWNTTLCLDIWRTMSIFLVITGLNGLSSRSCSAFLPFITRPLTFGRKNPYSFLHSCYFIYHWKHQILSALAIATMKFWGRLAFPILWCVMFNWRRLTIIMFG